VFQGVVLLRGHRAGQPEPGPVYHVLRAPAQGGRAGRHRARAGVHPGHGPGRDPATVAGRQVLLGRGDRRVLGVHALAVHCRPASRGDGHVLRQRLVPDRPVQPGHVPVLRAGPRQLAAGGGGPAAT